MNLFSKNRADNFFKYDWLCDPNLANWIINLLSAYGTSILDVGCGNGFMLNFYMKTFNKIAAIEPSDSFVNILNETIKGNNIIYKQANAELIPFPDNSFEIVLAKSSLHHFHDIQQGLSEMQRVSNKIIAVMEVIAPSEECLPFLQKLLVEKEDGRKKSTVYTKDLLRNTIISTIQLKQMNQLLFDQYIDIETWLQYSDLSNERKKNLLNYILSMDSVTANYMQLHKRDNKYMMLRRMCLCIAFIN